MSQADRARLTPYELVFTAGDFEAGTFPTIRSEAEAQGVDTRLRERFDFLSTAADVVREVVPEDAAPDALDQYRAFLFHAFHFWSSGKRLYMLDSATARYLVEAAPNLEGWKFSIPGSSAYLQLPANLFWSSISAETPPEPVDGVFVTLGDGPDSLGAPTQLLEALMVLGIRRSRAGFSVIPLVSETGEGISEAWDAEGRAEGDFANALPGGEMAGLYSMLTVAEVLKLIGRAFWYIDMFPEALLEVPALSERGESGDAPTSQLGHILVTLTAPEDMIDG